MRGVLRRETFIALRARRTAYRIASTILNPHIDDDQPPFARRTPLDPKDVLPPLARVRTMHPALRWLLIFVNILLIAYPIVRDHHVLNDDGNR